MLIIIFIIYREINFFKKINGESLLNIKNMDLVKKSIKSLVANSPNEKIKKN